MNLKDIPSNLIEFEPERLPCEETEVLIIGSGAAGLRAAIEASNYAKVIVATKERVKDSATNNAQGGIAVALQAPDSPREHLEDTLSVGAGLCNEAAVKILVEEGVERVKELIQWGARFDREDGNFSFTKEGAHRRRRILHSHGDATGAEIENTLLAKCREKDNISFLEHAFCVDLILCDDECLGALFLRGKELFVVWADATILATGGLGQLYANTTNPPVATGDGFAIAYRAGCTLQDLEFVQFHPTALYVKGAPNFLISESVRGEGGVLRDKDGYAFMKDYHPLGDLAPRDITSRAIISQMEKTSSECVYLDVRHIDPEYLRRRFPTIFEACYRYGIDITRELIPVRPAAHFAMGGVRVDLEGESDIKRLFACGEVACTGVHGANRLASNSLLEGLVFGKRCGEYAQKYVGKACRRNIGKTKVAQKGEYCYNSGDILASLKCIMEQNVGIVRNGCSLNEAKTWVEERIGEVLNSSTPSRQEMELADMLITAYLIIVGALERKESRGAHFREDFPEVDDENWRRHITLRRGEK